LAQVLFGSEIRPKRKAHTPINMKVRVIILKVLDTFVCSFIILLF